MLKNCREIIEIVQGEIIEILQGGRTLIRKIME